MVSVRQVLLYDLDAEKSHVVGNATETDAGVVIALPPDYGFNEFYNQEISVLQPDSSRILIKPGDPKYFEEVLLDLSRVFAIGTQ